MSNDSRAPLKLSLGDREISLSPLTVADMGDISSSLKSAVINSARRCLSSDMTGQERQEILDAAFRSMNAMDFMGPEMRTYMNSIKGVIHLFYLSARHNHPSLTMDDALSLLEDPSNRSVFVNSLHEMLPGASNKDSEDESSDPTEEAGDAKD